MRGGSLRYISVAVVTFIVTSWPVIGLWAQDGPDYVGAKPPYVGGEVARNASGGHSFGILPMTGMAIGTMVIIAVALIIVGRLLMHRSSASTSRP